MHGQSCYKQGIVLYEGDNPATKHFDISVGFQAALNTHYPTKGRWQFTLHQLIAEADLVVSNITVSEGNHEARALTFSTVKDGKMTKQVKYWPELYEAPISRKQWVEPLS